MLETLIADQFFDAPRNISQIIEHVQHRYARTYKATDLSPTLVRLRRENKLDRSKNDKGIYISHPPVASRDCASWNRQDRSGIA